MNWRLGAQPRPGPPDKKTRRTRDSMDYVAIGNVDGKVAGPL